MLNTLMLILSNATQKRPPLQWYGDSDFLSSYCIMMMIGDVSEWHLVAEYQGETL